MQLIKVFRCIVLVTTGAAAAVAQPAEAKTQSSPAPLTLKVVGTQIVNTKNEPVRLRGVNCASLEWTSNGERHILESVLQAIEDHQWSYTAWDFHPSAGPTLISGWDYTPSLGFGVYVKRMLEGTWTRYTLPNPIETPTQPDK